MTSGCSRAEGRRPHGRPFHFNPFEIAVCGEDSGVRSNVIAGLTAALESTHVVGQVLVRAPQMAPETVEQMGVSLIRGDGQRGLMYPEFMDDYLGARPLVDVDIAVVESAEDIDMPKVLAVGGGKPPPAWTRVLAYAGPPGSCPVLPSSAHYFTLTQMGGLADCVQAYFAECVEQTPLNGLVLAGGRSTRMGADKATLDYHGKPQVAHCHELLSNFCDRVYVSSRPDQVDSAGHQGLEHIHDAFLGFGPMGGILSALKADPGAAWLVLACDLPFVDYETLSTLVHLRNPFKLATAFQSARDGLPEPLCAIFEPKCLYRLLEFLALGYHCPRKVLINSDTQLLDPPEGSALENVNHPGEYEQAVAALRARPELSHD